MPRGGLPEVLNNAVQTMTVNTTNRKGTHLYVTSRMTLRDRINLSMWNISGRIVQEALTDYGWLSIEFHYQASCSRMPSHNAFYSPPEDFFTALYFPFFMSVPGGKNLPSGEALKALDVSSAPGKFETPFVVVIRQTTSRATKLHA